MPHRLFRAAARAVMAFVMIAAMVSGPVAGGQIVIASGDVVNGDVVGNASGVGANDFSVTVEEGAEVTGFVYGARSNAASGIQSASRNAVTIQGIVGAGVYGGEGSTNNGALTVADNSVVASNASIGGEIYGGNAASQSGNLTVTGNVVNVGGNSRIGGDLTSNQISVAGGFAASTSGHATSSGNTAVISGDATLDYDLLGGGVQNSAGDSTANDNILRVEESAAIRGSVIGGETWSYTGAASAVGNSVTLGDQVEVGRNIYGGYAESNSGIATATNNTIAVGGSANLSAASLFGGGNIDNAQGSNFFTGNTLKKNSNATIRDVHNFEFINFGYAGDANIGTLDTTGGEVKLNTGGHAISYNGTIIGSGSLKLLGSGVLTLGRNDGINIGGKLTVEQGTLALSNNVTASMDGGLTFTSASQFTPNGNKLTVTEGVVRINQGAIINLKQIDIGNTVLSSSSAIQGIFNDLFYETEFNAARTELLVTGHSPLDNIVGDLADSGVTIGPNGSQGIGLINSIIHTANDTLRNQLYDGLTAIRDLAASGAGGIASTAFQQLIGQYNGRGIEMTRTTAQSFSGGIFGHLSQMRDSNTAMGGAQSNTAYASPNGSYYSPYRSGYRRAYKNPANRIWAGGFGAITRQSDDNGVSGYKYDAGGFILGYDHQVNQNLTVGFTGAYSNGILKGNEGYSKTEVDTVNFGAYASYNTQRGFYAEANLGVGYVWNREREYMVVLGGRRDGKYGTASAQIGGNVGYAFLLPSAFRITPSVGLQVIHAEQDDYEQTGNGLPMWRGSSAVTYVEIPLSVRVDKTFDLGNGISVTPEVRAAWICEAKNDSPSVRAGYVGSSSGFTLSGTNPGRHRGLIGAGVKARFSSKVDAFVDYNFEFRNRYQNHNIMAGLGLSF